MAGTGQKERVKTTLSEVRSLVLGTQGLHVTALVLLVASTACIWFGVPLLAARRPAGLNLTRPPYCARRLTPSRAESTAT